jgi:hypothetical protein
MMMPNFVPSVNYAPPVVEEKKPESMDQAMARMAQKF